MWRSFKAAVTQVPFTLSARYPCLCGRYPRGLQTRSPGPNSTSRNCPRLGTLALIAGADGYLRRSNRIRTEQSRRQEGVRTARIWTRIWPRPRNSARKSAKCAKPSRRKAASRRRVGACRAFPPAFHVVPCLFACFPRYAVPYICRARTHAVACDVIASSGTDLACAASRCPVPCALYRCDTSLSDRMCIIPARRDRVCIIRDRVCIIQMRHVAIGLRDGPARSRLPRLACCHRPVPGTLPPYAPPTECPVIT